MKIRPVTFVNAKHFTDDRHGYLQCEIMHQIHLTSSLHAINQFVRKAMNAILHLPDQTRRERQMHQRTQARVIRRVQVQHVALEWFEERWHPRFFLRCVSSVAAILDQSLVLERRLHIVVARHNPGPSPEQFDRYDWTVVSPAFEGGERIGFEFGCGDVGWLEGD